MIYRSLFALAVIAQTCSLACGQYVINLRAESGGSQSHVPGFDYVRFDFAPNISLLEEVSPGTLQPSAAKVTLESPNALFTGYANHPDGTSSSQLPQASTADVTSEVNGIWRLTLDDGGNVFEYQVGVAFAPPFAELPYFTSSTLVNGNEAGPFSWQLNGGSPAYPGTSSQLYHARLMTTSFVPLASAFLPAGSTQWTPPVSLAGNDDFLGQVFTSQVASDLSSLQVTAVTAITPGAPALSFGATSIDYRAQLSARLTPIAVPEPASCVSMAVALTMSLGLMRRLR